MLVNVVPHATIALMSKQMKRTRITPSKNAAVSITVRQYNYEKDGKFYHSHLVQGWKENGKWKKKEFKDKKDAERFAAIKRIQLENQGREQRLILCPLSEDQIAECVTAYSALGDTYTLTQAVQFFLANHRAPDFIISIKDACKAYLDAKERDLLRPRSIEGIEWSITKFIEFLRYETPMHEINQHQVNEFLHSLRAKNGTDKASRRSWELHRGILSSFFAWCMEADKTSNRPYVFLNPADKVQKFTAKQVAEQRPETITTAPEDVQRIFSHLMTWKDGALVKYYALAYFAGIRPSGELVALAERENELINLRTGIIIIPAAVAKTKEARKITIPANLAAWLTAYKAAPILPKNFEAMNKAFRKSYQLTHDEARHSFISYHVAVNRSVGDAALQAGNSESIVKKHYLNLHPREDGEHFFSLVPDMANMACIRNADCKLHSPHQLRAIG